MTHGRPDAEANLSSLPRANHVRWVRAGIVMAVVGYSVVLLAKLSLGTGPTLSWITEAMVVGAGLIGLHLAGRDRISAAGILIASAVWLELLGSVVQHASLSTSAVVALPVLVSGAGLLMGRRAALIMATATALALPVALALGRALATLATGEPPRTARMELGAYLTVVPCLYVAAGLVGMAIRVANDAVLAALESERRIRTVLNETPDGILTLDEAGRIDEMNPAAARILGGDPVGLEGESFVTVVAGPTDTDAREAAHRLASRRNLHPVLLTIRHGARALHVEATSDRTEGPPDGRVRVQVVLRDVTARRRAESRAGQLGRMLQGALSEVYILDPAGSGRLIMASRGARENLGYETDLAGLHPQDINPTWTTERLSALLDQLDPTTVTPASRGIHRRKDGSIYPVETRVQEAELDERRVLVAFVVDVSERVHAEEDQRRLQQQLEHAQRMEAVGRLAGGVAHDFNNLLTVVGGCAELLIDTADDEVRELAGEIVKAQERGASLTRQLLAFARKEVVQLSVLDLADFLPRTRPLLQRLVGEQVDLEIDVEGRPRIVADPGQIEQVLLNLAANARDAMPDGGTLRLSARESVPGRGEEQRFAVLTVTDEGVGMDPDTLDRACEPFFTTKPRERGTGLGLSTVHGIVAQNNGEVFILSERGVGTRVVVRWPEAAPSEERSETARPAESRAGDRERGTVLVVEDNDGARRLVHLVLERAGYAVVSAADAREGLAAFNQRSRDVDLVLTDVVMPGRSGLELAQEIREVRGDVPILFMSGYLEDRIEGVPGIDPARDLILKPFRTDELRHRVASAMAKPGVRA